MKNRMFWMILTAASISSVSANYKSPPPTKCTPQCTNPTLDNFIIEFRPNYFHPLSSHFRTLFSGGIDYQLTISCPVYWGENAWMRGINIFAAGDYYSRNGHSTFMKNKTSISIVPVTLGLKYFFPALGDPIPVTFYVASGMKYYFVHTHNKSHFVQKNIHVNGMGGMVESGVIAVFREHLVFDLFVSGSFKTLGPPSVSGSSSKGSRLNVSSINAGGGIGYKY